MRCSAEGTLGRETNCSGRVSGTADLMRSSVRERPGTGSDCEGSVKKSPSHPMGQR